jgi:hypothetical protein
MKLINILLEETGHSLKWGELTVQKLRDMGFDKYKDGVKLPSEQGEHKIVWGAAIMSTGREEAAAMRSAEAKLSRYKKEIEDRFDVNIDTEVVFNDNVASIEGVETMSPEDQKAQADAYADLKARGIEKFGTSA